MTPLRPELKLLWIGLTDLRKIARERRTMALVILLPVIVVIVVGTTFSLGYQEFEARELAVGVLRHRNSTYADAIMRAISKQNATAILYETLEDAKRDLKREKIDTIIEVDPWIDEKMALYKKCWIAIHADETRPLLTAAVEVVMLQTKQEVVDDLVWEYVSQVQEKLIPGLNRTLAAITRMLEEGVLNPELEGAISLLAKISKMEDETVEVMAGVIDAELRRMAENGTLQEQIVVSLIDRSTIVGTLWSLRDAKPLLDSAYHLLRYVYPHLEDPEVIPTRVLGDLSSLTRNLTEITDEQAALILAALPLVRPKLIETLSAENSEWDLERAEGEADSLIAGTRELLVEVAERRDQLTNAAKTISNVTAMLGSFNARELVEEARGMLDQMSGMEEGFVTSPIYLVRTPLYFAGDMRYVDYISPGVFAFGILFSVLVYTVLSVVRDREKGLLRRIFVCNVGRWSYAGGKCLACLVISAVQVLILTVCARLLFDIYVANLPKTFLLGIYSSIGFVGLGLLISSVTKTELEAVTASMGLVFVMLMVSGVFFPFELSPSIVRQASAYIPVTYVANLLKAGIIRDANLGEMAGDLVLVGMYGGLSLLVGILAFRWRKRG